VSDGEAPWVIIIAGPNGAGKSTAAPFLLQQEAGVTDYVNADVIAQGLSAFAPEGAAFEAGRVMLQRIKQLSAEHRSFAFETTLASRHFARTVRELKEDGYRFQLIFLLLDEAETAIERVASRVAMGGHHVPEETIRRRFDRGLSNLFRVYLDLTDRWIIYNNSDVANPRLIARGTRVTATTVEDEDAWRRLQERYAKK